MLLTKKSIAWVIQESKLEYSEGNNDLNYTFIKSVATSAAYYLSS